MMVSFDILWRWVFAVCAGSVVLGLALMVLPGRGILSVYDAGMLNPFFDDVTPSAAAIELYRFKMCVIGAAIVGWGVTLCFVVAVPFRRRELWAWWAVAAGAASWIALESIACVAWGVGVELLFLAAALVAFSLPLALCRRHFVAVTLSPS